MVTIYYVQDMFSVTCDGTEIRIIPNLYCVLSILYPPLGIKIRNILHHILTVFQLQTKRVYRWMLCRMLHYTKLLDIDCEERVWVPCFVKILPATSGIRSMCHTTLCSIFCICLPSDWGKKLNDAIPHVNGSADETWWRHQIETFPRY